MMATAKVKEDRFDCGKCGTDYTRELAEPCGCISERLTYACPLCGHCSCDDRVRQAFQPASVVEEIRQSLEAPGREIAEDAPLVLVADDSPVVVTVTSRVLERLGYRVVTASSGREALQKIYQLGPDLAVLDALMPGYDGRELCRIIKAHPATKDVRVVIMTGLYRSRAQMDEAHRKFGVDDYLAKPVAPEDLQKSVTRLVAH